MFDVLKRQLYYTYTIGGGRIFFKTWALAILWNYMRLLFTFCKVMSKKEIFKSNPSSNMMFHFTWLGRRTKITQVWKQFRQSKQCGWFSIPNGPTVSQFQKKKRKRKESIFRDLMASPREDPANTWQLNAKPSKEYRPTRCPPSKKWERKKEREKNLFLSHFPKA